MNYLNAFTNWINNFEKVPLLPKGSLRGKGESDPDNCRESRGMTR